MLDTVTKFIRALRIPTTEELESRYLNEASSRYDLEQREREVELEFGLVRLGDDRLAQTRDFGNRVQRRGFGVGRAGGDAQIDNLTLGGDGRTC